MVSALVAKSKLLARRFYLFSWIHQIPYSPFGEHSNERVPTVYVAVRIDNNQSFENEIYLISEFELCMFKFVRSKKKDKRKPLF